MSHSVHLSGRISYTKRPIYYTTCPVELHQLPGFDYTRDRIYYTRERAPEHPERILTARNALVRFHGFGLKNRFQLCVVHVQYGRGDRTLNISMPVLGGRVSLTARQ